MKTNQVVEKGEEGKRRERKCTRNAEVCVNLCTSYTDPHVHMLITCCMHMHM